MGIVSSTMARWLALLMAALFASQALSAEVQTLDDVTEGEITYRISFTTASEGEQTVSNGNFKIQIKGDKGDTGEKFLVSHPGYACGADGDSPRCYTNEHGIVPTKESRGSATCPCDPNLEEYNEENAKWTKETGQHRLVFIKAADVGEIKEVKITGDSGEKWKMEGMKINTNSVSTGLGAGIFYVQGAIINKAAPLEAELSASTTAGDDMGSVPVGEACAKDADCKSGRCDTGNTFNCELKCLAATATAGAEATANCPVSEEGVKKITRCDAQVCEEEMDKMFKFA